MRIREACNELAGEQHGAIGIWQVRALGGSRDQVFSLRRSGGWEERTKRVLVSRSAPATERQALMVASLDTSPGSVIAGPAAARMWGAPQFRPHPIDVLRHKGIARRDSDVANVHEVVDLAPNHIKVVDGIPVTSPARTVCDLAGSHPHLVERVLDRFWSERLLDGRTFRRTVEELKDRGRKGSTLFRELDAARGPGYVPPASSLERRFMEICVWPMHRQVDSGGEEWCGRVDFRHERLPLIVEIQSERYHTALVDKIADATRRAKLEAAGFHVVEIWDVDVWHRPQLVNDTISAAYRQVDRPSA
jgi:hypothetical protein